MRASAVVEKAGIPTALLVCDGFLGQGAVTAGGLGIRALPIARLVGHVDGQDASELRDNVRRVTTGDVVRHLTRGPEAGTNGDDFASGDIVAEGSFDAVNEIFEARGWTDGLPIVPPTAGKVAAFLARTDDDPERVIGTLRPAGRAATVGNVAVNGVMAGCRPDYMPVLIAVAEVLADPGYGVEHSGDTTGGDALIMLSGPIIQELGFYTENASMREGTRANTSVGRFLRLFLRNVAGCLPGAGDKSTFGNPAKVVLAEHEDEVRKLGWPLFAQDRGFDAGTNVVTIARFTSGGVIGSIYSNDPEVISAYLADGLVRHSGWELIFTVGFAPGTYRPLLVISPMVAKTLARAGWSKADFRQALFRHARLPASKMETFLGPWTNLLPGRPKLGQLVAAGSADPLFAEADDPDRLVPIVKRAEDIMILVSGDPLRSNAFALASNGMHGFPTSREIRPPER